MKKNKLALFTFSLIALIVALPLCFGNNSAEDNIEPKSNFQQKRRDLNLTLEQLAKFSGLSVEYLAGVDNGTYVLGEPELSKIGPILGLD